MRIIFWLVTGCCLFFCCGRVDTADVGRYPYTLKDFRPELRQELQKLITTGFFGDATQPIEEFLEEHASDAELLKMAKCEHPLIRAFGLTATLDRPNIDHYSVLMHHLDDTAHIAWYAQCTSNPFEYVSDYFINAFDKWKTVEEKQKTIHEVLTKHNYLMSAYTILHKVNADPRYYEAVRTMAQREMYVSFYLERAWHALARYKKPADVPLLVSNLDAHWDDFGALSFSLMQEYPDAAYMPLLEIYYKKRFYKDMCEQIGLERPFLAALAVYQNQASAALATRISEVDPAKFCYSHDKKYLQYSLYESLVSNKCPVYERVIARLEPLVASQKNEPGLKWEIPDTPAIPAEVAELKSW